MRLCCELEVANSVSGAALPSKARPPMAALPSAGANVALETELGATCCGASNNDKRRRPAYQESLAARKSAKTANSLGFGLRLRRQLVPAVSLASLLFITTLILLQQPQLGSTKSLTIATGDQQATTTSNNQPQPEESLRTTAGGQEESSITTTSQPAEVKESEENQDELAGASNDDDDAEGCKGLSAHESAETKNISDVKRLVNLQSCIQEKVKAKLMGATRSGLEVFEKLSLSGGCTSSLMNLMTSFGQIKSFAFKFLDASAKVPSGMMYGLLSDFGDFDQCLSIRSNPAVPVEEEAEEGAYSGKYCLMNIKSRYHVDLEPNVTVPEGILADGVLWDDLVKNYWTSKSPKGFQVGMCFPSRCTDDDLNQIYQYVAESYYAHGEIISCQDSLDLKQQHTPNLIQRLIIYSFYVLVSLTILGTIIDRYYRQLCQHESSPETRDSLTSRHISLAKALICFSLARNWKTFTRVHGVSAERRSTYWPHADGDSSSSVGSVKTTDENARTVSEGLSMRNSVLGHLSDCSTLGSGGDAHKLGQLTVHVQQDDAASATMSSLSKELPSDNARLSHLSGLRLLVIFWITIGHSFLYPSANNYQHYRSIINMNITRNSVWFATTNFTLGIDMLLYMTGLVFVYKLAKSGTFAYRLGRRRLIMHVQPTDGCGIVRLMAEKILRFWPTYLTVIGLAIVAPLAGDGPMWPEMVVKKIGASCQRNWWTNLLFINNYQKESEICLPSSWFVSNLMQLFLIGSVIILLHRRYSIRVAIAALVLLLISSCAYSFAFAHLLNLRAPVIRMDESFVMEMDENIWRLYINIFSNLGPFLIGMAGGFILLKSCSDQEKASSRRNNNNSHNYANAEASPQLEAASKRRLRSWLAELVVGLVVTVVAILVLSSVFHENYSRLASSLYWSLHRIGWAIVTGYVVHNCAMGKWKLLNDLLSLSTFIPFSRLIFIAYLVYPIYIHMHSGLVRDGLHVSIYNMLNIYTTRLVMTFTTALLIHLLVELPLCSLEELYLGRFLWRLGKRHDKANEAINGADESAKKIHPLLAVAPVVSLKMGNDSVDVTKRGGQVERVDDNIEINNRQRLLIGEKVDDENFKMEEQQQPP